MPEELFTLLIGLGLSILIGLIFSLPSIIWRAIKRRPLIPKGDKIESPNIFYLGLILFGGSATLAFFFGKPYFGLAFLLIFLVYLFFLVAYKKGKLGASK